MFGSIVYRYMLNAAAAVLKMFKQHTEVVCDVVSKIEA